MGFIYRVTNGDFDIKSKNVDLMYDNFEFGLFLSNYREDNLDEKLEELVFELIDHIKEIYNNEYEAGKVTSISNFLKTDKKYRETILDKYITKQKMRTNLNDLIDYFGPLFTRSN